MILSDDEIIGIKDYAELIRKLEILAVDMHWQLLHDSAEAIRELVRQRDELLAALELIATGEEVNGCIPSLGWAVDIADNAIASVKGQA